MRRAHDPVLQPEMSQLEGLENRVECGHGDVSESIDPDGSFEQSDGYRKCDRSMYPSMIRPPMAVRARSCGAPFLTIS
jgi:hypothetical protein